MFERFTEDARRALFFARYQAIGRASAGIDLADLAAGALRVIPPPAWDGWGASQSIAAVAERLGRDATPAAATPDVAHIPFAAATRRALHAAAALADRHQHRDIDVRHLLAAILGERGDEAARILAAAGLTEQRLLASVRDAAHADEPLHRTSLSTAILGTSGDPQRWQTEALRVVDSLFIETDRKNWDAVRALFVDTPIVVDMSSLVGGGAVSMSADDLIAGFRSGLHAGKASHHMTANYRVDLDEMHGITVTAHGYAWNHIEAFPAGQQLWETWGTYRIGLARTSAGWKIELFAYYSRLTRGNDAVRRHTAS